MTRRISFYNYFRRQLFRGTMRAGFHLPSVLKGILFLLPIFLIFGEAYGASIPLCPLLSSAPSGGTVTLDSANTYTLSAECVVNKTLTINGMGAPIQGTGPIRADGSSVTLTIDHCVINSTGWGGLAAKNGSHLIVQNSSSISCPGPPTGTGIYVGPNSTLTVQSSSVTSCFIGVNMDDPSTGALHGVTITGCPYAVQVQGTSSSVTVDQNSSLTYSGPTSTGVGIISGASAVIHDSTFVGFDNAIDVQPFTPGGTAQVVNCSFSNSNVSALSVVGAQNVLFSGSRVEGAQHDGLYFDNSTGVVENSQIIGSLNTGISFYGCPNGATIRNSLLINNAHQGVSVVLNPGTGLSSQNIQVLNNTFVANQVTNLLIDAVSTAKVQGNIFTQAPNSIYSIRLHGAMGITLDSALVTDSFGGVEIKGGSNPKIVLSEVSENDRNGFLVYENNSFLTAEHSFFWDNGLSATGGTSDSYSIFVTEGAKVNAHRCTFGPAGKWAFYNNTANTCDVSYDYWAASNGPTVASWILIPPNGSGAHLDSSYQNPFGPVTYTPFLTQPPVDSNVNLNVSLPSGGSLTWDSQLGATLALTAKTNSTALSGEISGVLRVNDTASLNLVTPPDGLLPGQLYVVWVSTPLRLNSASGSLTFSLPSQDGPVALVRREIDGSWTSVSSVWDVNLHILTYTPSDVNLLNGTFALTSVPNIIYVKKNGNCAGKTPCFASIQDAIDSAQTFTIIEITQETYDEDIVVDDPKVLTLEGGWDSTFTTHTSTTTINGSLTISDGKLVLDVGGLIVE